MSDRFTTTAEEKQKPSNFHIKSVPYSSPFSCQRMQTSGAISCQKQPQREVPLARQLRFDNSAPPENAQRTSCRRIDKGGLFCQGHHVTYYTHGGIILPSSSYDVLRLLLPGMYCHLQWKIAEVNCRCLEVF